MAASRIAHRNYFIWKQIPMTRTLKMGFALSLAVVFAAASIRAALNVTSVISQVNTDIGPIQVAASGSTLSLAWPTNVVWTLMTNSVGLTAANQCFPYPGTSLLTDVNITIVPRKDLFLLPIAISVSVIPIRTLLK